MAIAVHAGDIARMLVDESNAIVRLASRTLGILFDCKTGPGVRTAAAKSIADMMEHPSSAIRETAVRALGNISLVGVLAPYISKLVRMLDDPSHCVSLQASVALQCQPATSLSSCVGCVVDKLTASREFVRKHALQTLRRIEPTVLASYAHCISQRLSDDSESVRESAVIVIACLQPAQTIAAYIDAIVPLLDDCVCVRVAVSVLLRKLHPVVLAPYVDVIALKLTDPSAIVRVTAVWILGKQEPMAFACHASAVSSVLTRTCPNGENRAARHAIRQFMKNINTMLDSAIWSTRRKALCAVHVAVAGYAGEMALWRDRHLATLIRRTEECESHQRQLVRLRRSCSPWELCDGSDAESALP